MKKKSKKHGQRMLKKKRVRNRNPCHNITTALTQLTSLIGDTSACLQCNHLLLDTLKHAHAELLSTAASIAGGSEDEE